MHQAQRMSFAIECLFECADSVIDVSAGWRALVRLPLMKREAESIQLRLEARQALLETRIVLVHRGSRMMIHKNERSVSPVRLRQGYGETGVCCAAGHTDDFRGELMSRQAVIVAALIVWVTAITHAQGARTVRDGVYTDAQAVRGQAIY